MNIFYGKFCQLDPVSVCLNMTGSTALKKWRPYNLPYLIRLSKETDPALHVCINGTFCGMGATLTAQKINRL